ncbi:M24 family metallopeptidase [Sphingomonas crocodyli]|uniref:Aminopeptidase P family protein n=1 Tax=Sphingomonas crocodyli TaxID=1979270 RepID=A0A437M5X6_9SPHN|nr:Xaa-Pro peptidase family protein [Sphingomonas crocodyli]RVT92965.1 aminopeptidase P family protein [Sphingomonas crocodyli]
MIGGSNAQEQLAELGPWSDPAPAITALERETRVELARRLTRSAGAQALLVVAGPSLNYFLGISWKLTERLVALIITQSDRPILIAPQFEEGSLAAMTALDVETLFWEEDESPYDLVASVLSRVGASAIALDPAMPFKMVDQLALAAPSVAHIEGSDIVDGCRMNKSTAELALMRQAKQMTLEVQRRVARILRPGISSSEVIAFIDAGHRALGAAGSTFCSVQFGRASAFPHGLPGPTHLNEGDIVLIDTGCAIQGYNSDITRTYVFGTPNQQQRDLWMVEAEAQQAAFDVVQPGVLCQEVDAAARRVLERAGLGPNYRLPGLPHRTGHGIGLAVHEAPYLVKGDRTPLMPGMCFSNEPTIIVPDKFGIRLEDHFFVTDSGAEWFTERSTSIDCPF